MNRLSDKAIEIINELHTERLDYNSEYVPLIDAAYKLSAYEDTEMEPHKIQVARQIVADACNVIEKWAAIIQEIEELSGARMEED